MNFLSPIPPLKSKGKFINPSKWLTMLLLLMTLTVNGFAQCGFDKLHKERLAKDTAYAKQVASFDQYVYRYHNGQIKKDDIAMPMAGVIKGSTVFVPVKVHLVVERQDNTVLNAEEISHSIEYLNDAFGRINFFTSDGGAVDVELRFSLVTIASCVGKTNTTADFNNGTADLNRLIGDCRNHDGKMLNIYIVERLLNASGYATFGGSIVLASFKDWPRGYIAEVIAHEVGHVLGLYHTFEGGCAAGDQMLVGDRCADTPADNAEFGPCVNNSCPTLEGNDPTDNYMDYSTCRRRFTQQQERRMRMALSAPPYNFGGGLPFDNDKGVLDLAYLWNWNWDSQYNKSPEFPGIPEYNKDFEVFADNMGKLVVRIKVRGEDYYRLSISTKSNDFSSQYIYRDPVTNKIYDDLFVDGRLYQNGKWYEIPVNVNDPLQKFYFRFKPVNHTCVPNRFSEMADMQSFNMIGELMRKPTNGHCPGAEGYYAFQIRPRDGRRPYYYPTIFGEGGITYKLSGNGWKFRNGTQELTDVCPNGSYTDQENGYKDCLTSDGMASVYITAGSGPAELTMTGFIGTNKITKTFQLTNGECAPKCAIWAGECSAKMMDDGSVEVKNFFAPPGWCSQPPGTKIEIWVKNGNCVEGVCGKKEFSLDANNCLPEIYRLPADFISWKDNQQYSFCFRIYCPLTNTWTPASCFGGTSGCIVIYKSVSPSKPTICYTYSSIIVSPGSEFEVGITIQNNPINPYIASIEGGFQFNSNVVTYVGSRLGDLFNPTTTVNNTSGSGVSAQVSISQAPTFSSKASGTVVYLKFRVNQNAPLGTKIRGEMIDFIYALNDGNPVKSFTKCIPMPDDISISRFVIYLGQRDVNRDGEFDGRDITKLIRARAFYANQPAGTFPNKSERPQDQQFDVFQQQSCGEFKRDIQLGNDWGGVEFEGQDMKYLDINGDGRVTSLDSQLLREWLRLEGCN